jgi:hypothetical protein
MRIDLFHMERTQCLYENEVQFNLSESGVDPLRVDDLLGGAQDVAWLRGLSLKYPASMGTDLLRERIALFYHGAKRDNVMVTNGGSEANFTTFWGLLDKGDRVAVMIPNYLQTRGLARAYGAGADPFRLVEGRGDGTGDGKPRWALDIEGLKRAVSRKTRIILVTNPNNPTGAVLTEDEMEEIIRAADRVGAFVVSDEVYRGAEVTGGTCPTFWDRYDKVIITAGLSKAFAMPGLRIGWVVAPPKTLAHLCRYHDYTTLTPTLLSERLAQLAMEPARREQILNRTRTIIRRNLPRLEEWIRTHDDIFTYIAPLAGAIATIRYDLPIASVALFDRLRLERSVLITPGTHFGIGKYLRIGYGYDIEHAVEGLKRIDLTIADLRRSGTLGAGAGKGRRGRAIAGAAKGRGRTARAAAE